MVKLLLGTVAALVLLVSEAQPQPKETFFEASLDHWAVTGIYGTKTINAACIMKKTYENGSFFGLAKDLEDEDLYFVIKNTDWHLRLKPGPQKFGLSVKSEKHNVEYPSVVYILIDENTMLLPKLTPEFLQAFAGEGTLTVDTQPRGPSPVISLEESLLGLKSMVDCMKAASKILILNPQKGQTAVNHEEHEENSRPIPVTNH